MNSKKFRRLYSHLGFITELLISNVVVGNLTWRGAIRLGDDLTSRMRGNR